VATLFLQSISLIRDCAPGRLTKPVNRREFFAEETSQGFWAVVDGLHPGAAEDTDDTATTEETLYGKVMQLANALLPSSSKRLLHYALLSRYYSPKVWDHHPLFAH
jgi:hypothetical protein